MKTRIIAAAVIIPIAIIILIVLPPLALTITLSIISAFAAHELFGAVNRLCKKTPSPRTTVYAIIGAVPVPFIVHFNNIVSQGIDAADSFLSRNNILLIGMLSVFLIVMCLLLIDFFLMLKPKAEKRLRLPQLLITPVAALVIPFLLASLVTLRLSEAGRWLVMLPIIVTVLTDSGAYFTGKAIGKHKPLPTLSPNKTVEGFAGGIVAGVVSIIIYGLIMGASTEYNVNYLILLVYGVVCSLMTEFGDLAFSFIKRKCGIKDYGSLIPGHGGMLDRFDSLIFTAPTMLLLVTLLPSVTIR